MQGGPHNDKHIVGNVNGPVYKGGGVRHKVGDADFRHPGWKLHRGSAIPNISSLYEEDRVHTQIGNGPVSIRKG